MKIYFIMLLLVTLLLSTGIKAQNVYNKEYLNQASLEELNQLLIKAKKTRTYGRIFTGVGVGALIAGVAIDNNLGSGIMEDANTADQISSGMAYVFLASTLIGIPILITGSSRHRKVKRAIANKTSLILSPHTFYSPVSDKQYQGISLKINF